MTKLGPVYYDTLTMILSAHKVTNISNDRDERDEDDEDEMTVCVSCGCPADYGAAYCQSCYDTLESEGFFEP